MLSNILSTSAVFLLSASLASAQTSSLCNPVKGQKCAADPAFGGTVSIDFTKGASDYFSLAAGTTLKYDDTKGAVFTIAEEANAPTITSTKYIFFGTVEVVVQAAPGTGIVSSFVLESDDLDEIDWEWIGGDTKQVQTNYYSKGDTTTYDRGGFSPVSSPQTGFHTYTVDWSPEAVVWSIDGTTVRTLTYAEAGNGKTFPQTPMQIKLGTWDGGSSTSPEGTVTWAGGRTPFGSGSGAPYSAYYKSIKITDRSNGVAGATAYSYSDTSGTYESIKVHTDGSVSNSTDTTSATTSTSTSKTGTATKSAKTATTDASAPASDATGTATKGKAATTLVATTGASGDSKTATGTKTTGTATAKAEATATTVSTSGVGKRHASLAGAVAAVLASLALL